MPSKAQDASGLAGLQLSVDSNVVAQAFRRLSLSVHPDKRGGNAALFAKLVAAKDLALQKIEEALRRGEDKVSKAAGRLKWLKCQCATCTPLILKCGSCLGCIRESGAAHLRSFYHRFLPIPRSSSWLHFQDDRS